MLEHEFLNTATFSMAKAVPLPSILFAIPIWQRIVFDFTLYDSSYIQSFCRTRILKKSGGWGGHITTCVRSLK